MYESQPLLDLFRLCHHGVQEPQLLLVAGDVLFQDCDYIKDILFGHLQSQSLSSGLQLSHVLCNDLDDFLVPVGALVQLLDGGVLHILRDGGNGLLAVLDDQLCDLVELLSHVLVAGFAVLVDGDELHALDIPVEVMELQVEDNQVGQVSIHISNIFHSIYLLKVKFVDRADSQFAPGLVVIVSPLGTAR